MYINSELLNNLCIADDRVTDDDFIPAALRVGRAPGGAGIRGAPDI
jgi:hypothetical protein